MHFLLHFCCWCLFSVRYRCTAQTVGYPGTKICGLSVFCYFHGNIVTLQESLHFPRILLLIETDVQLPVSPHLLPVWVLYLYEYLPVSRVQPSSSLMTSYFTSSGAASATAVAVSPTSSQYTSTVRSLHMYQSPRPAIWPCWLTPCATAEYCPFCIGC